jgi:hypothetical protein
MAAPEGIMEGHLKIVSPRVVEPSDNMPRPSFAPASYSKFSLIVLTRAAKKEIAHLPVAQDGSYRISLPPGDYILDLQDRAAKRIHAKPQPFTVVSNQSVRVDLTIFVGFHPFAADSER